MLTAVASLCAGLSLMTTPAAPAAKPAPTQKLELYAIEQHVIARTNAERIKNGLEPLLIDQSLVNSARKHTAWMTNNNTLQHGGGVAENIAMGQRNSAEVMQSWMNSSGHRANILNGSHRKIGVAAYTTANGTIYWCQQFTQ
jgi:uncharacterized protein YkwD